MGKLIRIWKVNEKNTQKKLPVENFEILFQQQIVLLLMNNILSIFT